MIRRIGIIYQGANDRGFLLGLRDRFDCSAELLDARIRGRTQLTVWRDAKSNWRYFRNASVDLVVRLTDSDSERWQDARRNELSRYPDDIASIFVCGATSGNVERWLSIDRGYLQAKLGIPTDDVLSVDDLTGRVKRAISKHPSIPDDSEVVRDMVLNAPPAVFRAWLGDGSFRSFYDDCRSFVLRHHSDCPIRDEMKP